MSQGERIREIRKTLGLTLEKFGARIGLKKNSLSQLENGKNSDTEQVIKALCREYNVNEEWLKNGTGEMFNEPSDDVAEIVSEFIENPESEFYKIVLALAQTYMELSPENKATLDKYAKDLLNNIKKLDTSDTELNHAPHSIGKSNNKPSL